MKTDPLSHFLHPVSDQLEQFPYRPRFAADVWQTARALWDRDWRHAAVLAQLRHDDDLNTDADRLFWVEVRRACKCQARPWSVPMMD